jgi:hypothetical protein
LRRRAFVAGEVGDYGGDERWVHAGEVMRASGAGGSEKIGIGTHVAGLAAQPATDGVRKKAVDGNARRRFLRHDIHQANHCRLCRSIIAADRVAENAGLRTDENDAAVTLRAHQPIGGLGDKECALDVHRIDRVDIGFGEVAEANVSLIAGIVDDNVNAAEILDGSCDDCGAAGFGCHRVVVGDRAAAGGANFFHHAIGVFAGTALARGAATKVVDNHGGAAGGESQAVGAAKAATRPGDDRDTAGEIEFFH